jgi:hypothetical protein
MGGSLRPGWHRGSSGQAPLRRTDGRPEVASGGDEKVSSLSARQRPRWETLPAPGDVMGREQLVINP